MQKQTNNIQKEPEVKTQDLEGLLEQREKLVHMRDEIDASLKVISEELVIYLDEQKLKGTIIGDWTVSKATRLSFKTPLDWASQHGATKLAVDNSKLKALYQKGVEVPEVNITNYVLIKQVDKSDS